MGMEIQSTMVQRREFSLTKQGKIADACELAANMPIPPTGAMPLRILGTHAQSLLTIMIKEGITLLEN
jgi:hypothetical protein